jgi:hypothetical protein
MILSEAGADNCINGFTGGLNGGAVQFHTAADAEVAKCGMNNPAFNASSGGVASMITTPPVADANTVAGTIDHAHMLDSGDQIDSEMTCGLVGAEFIFTSLTFANDETLVVASLTVAWPFSVLT